METSPSLTGQLILSTPVIPNGLFHKSVILLTDHDDSGAQGYILNHPTSKTVGHLIKDPKLAPLKDIRVHLGGPVSQENLTFTALHWNHTTNLLEYHHRISAKDAIDRQKDPDTIIRAFVGYAGWEEGQLEDELLTTSWFPLPPSAQLLIHSHTPKLWKKTLNDAGPKYQLIANTPDNPQLN